MGRLERNSDDADPFRIGLAGEHPLGYEGLVARMGLPRERILDVDLDDLDVLAQYDLLLVCSPGPDVKGFPQAFDKYLKSLKTAGLMFGPTSGSRFYKTTEKGVKYLNNFESFSDIMIV